MRTLALLLVSHAALAQLTIKVIEHKTAFPLAQATVEVRFITAIDPTRRMRPPVIPICETGESGECQFGLPVTGYYRINVSRDGFVDAEDPLSRIASFNVAFTTRRGVSLDVVLVRTGSVEGALYSEDGKPVALAPLKLRLMTPVEPGRTVPPIYLRTRDDGSFRATGIPPGNYGLWIATPDSLRRAGRHISESGDETGYPLAVYHTGVEEEHWVEPVTIWPGAMLTNRVVVLRRMRVHPLRGRLIDQLTKQPLTTARVALRSADGLHEEIVPQRAVDPRDGSFEISGLSPGNYELCVYRPSGGPSPPWVVPFSVERGRGVPPLELSVPPWASVYGHFSVPMRRMPAGQLSLAFEPVAAPDEIVPAQVDTDGAFPPIQMPPGPYTLKIGAPEGCYPAEARIGAFDALQHPFNMPSTNMASLHIRISCDTGTMRGAVVDSRDRPLPRAYVVLAPADESWRGREGAVRTMRSGLDGEFAASGLRPGRYRIVALKSRPPWTGSWEDFFTKYSFAVSTFEVTEGFSATVHCVASDPRPE